MAALHPTRGHVENRVAEILIEKAWNSGYTGELGPRPKEYVLHVEDNNVIFSKFERDDEELVHLCLNCILLDFDFISSLLPENPQEHLRNLVCLTLEQKVKYLASKIDQ